MSLSQGSGDPEQWRVLLHQETQNLREELRREMREQLGEQPNLEQLLSGNLGQARVPPELLRNSGRKTCLTEGKRDDQKRNQTQIQ